MSRTITLTQLAGRLFALATLTAAFMVPTAAARPTDDSDVVSRYLKSHITDTSDVVSRYLRSHSIELASSPAPVSDNANSLMIERAAVVGTPVSDNASSQIVARAAANSTPVSDNANSQAVSRGVRPVNATPVSVVQPKDGFDWADAGIGAGGALVCVLLALLAGVGVSRRRRPLAV
jgi:hypothetical protein